MDAQDTSKDRWSKPVVILHWATALLVFAILTAGFLMTRMEATDPMRRNLGRLHTVSGNLLGLLTLARLVVLRRATRPAALAVSTLHQKGVAIVHVLLYVLTLAVIATGLGTALRTSWHEYLKGDLPKPPVFDSLASRQVHEVLAFVLALHVAAHVVGVVVHELRTRRALRRIVPLLR